MHMEEIASLMPRVHGHNTGLFNGLVILRYEKDQGPYPDETCSFLRGLAQLSMPRC